MEPLNDQLRELGQYIPLHYHHIMLADEVRMNSFRESIEAVVPEGGVVLELGGGTGALSFFAAKKARKVYCVERNPDLLDFAAKTLARNGRTDRIELVSADASEYMPPEPVDVVVCEMLHVALIREKQINVLDAFKKRYAGTFGSPMPLFIPDTSLLAVQAVFQRYDLNGYFAPIPVFQPPYNEHQNTMMLSEPKVYSVVEYAKPLPMNFEWTGTMQITEPGMLNALRFITKNLVSVLPRENRSIDWHNHYLVLPLREPISVVSGDSVQVSFRYTAGAKIQDLEAAINVARA